jgi:hypothetical protein
VWELKDEERSIRAHAATNLLRGFGESTLTYATQAEAVTAGAVTTGVVGYGVRPACARRETDEPTRYPYLSADTFTTTAAAREILEHIKGTLPPLDVYLCVTDHGQVNKALMLGDGSDRYNVDDTVYLQGSVRMPPRFAVNAMMRPWYVSTWDEQPRLDPFMELLDDKVAEAKNLIAEWALAKGAESALVQRLSDLVNDARDESPETDVPSTQALTSVFSLFRTLPTLPKARLAVAGAAGIWAEWVKDQHHSLALQFLRNGSVNVAAFFLDPEDHMRAGSYASNFSWKKAAKALRTDDALNWVMAA